MLNSVKAKKTLYFTVGMEATEEDMAAVAALGAGVSIRNAEFVEDKPNPGQIEKCDFVAGHVPKAYQHFPRAVAAPAPAPVAPPAPPATTEQPQPPSAVPPSAVPPAPPAAPTGGAWAGAPVVPPALPQS